MYRRLCLHDEPAHQHPDGDQHPALIQRGDLLSQIGAGRQEAHVDAGHEQDQSNVSIQETHYDFQYAFSGKMQGNHLEYSKKSRNRRQRRPHFLCIYRKPVGKQPPQLPAVSRLRHNGGDVASGCRIQQRQDQHRQHRPHGTQRHQAEAVLTGLAVASGGGDAHAQSHDKGDGHRACGDAAGIKCHRQKISGSKGGQGENYQIGDDQQAVQRNLKQDPQQRHHQKGSHACRHSADQHGVGDAGYLPRQHLKIRLGDRDDHADQEADQNHHPQLPGLGHLCAYPLADRQHGGVSTQRKKSHSYDQQDSAYQKGQQHI